MKKRNGEEASGNAKMNRRETHIMRPQRTRKKEVMRIENAA